MNDESGEPIEEDVSVIRADELESRYKVLVKHAGGF